MVEQRTHKPLVPGSIPGSGTNFLPPKERWFGRDRRCCYANLFCGLAANCGSTAVHAVELRLCARVGAISLSASSLQIIAQAYFVAEIMGKAKFDRSRSSRVRAYATAGVPSRCLDYRTAGSQ